MKVCTITHDASGCRIAFGDGITHNYANATYLAESLARSMAEATELRREQDRRQRILNTTTADGTAEELRKAIQDAIAGDVPF